MGKGKEINLKQMQEMEYEILKVFHQFCVKNNLRYFLACGTLLGAVRHKGFIPWDDDIDVFMPRPDYEKFLFLTQNGLTSRYDVLSIEYIPEYIYPFAKISDNTTILIEERIEGREFGLYVDVFPLDGSSSLQSELKRHAKELFFIGYATHLSVKIYKGGDLITTIKNIIVCPFFKLVGYKFWLKIYNLIIKKYKWEDCETVCNATSDNILKNNFPKTFFDDPILIQFEQDKFYAIANYDEMLKKQYDDYMTPPPKEQQKKYHNNVAYFKI